MKKTLSLIFALVLFVSANTINAQSISEQEQIQILLARIQALQQAIAALQQGGNVNYVVNNNCPPLISRNLEKGSVGNDVTDLQRFLRDNGFSSTNLLTNTFDSTTEKNVKAYQTARGIVSSGDPSTTGYGYVGPKTRSSINSEHCSSNSGGSDNGGTVVNNGFSVDVDTDKSTYKPGDVIKVTGKFTNNTGRDFQYNGCNDFKVEVDGVDEGGSYGFCYSSQRTLRDGQTAILEKNFTIDSKFNDDGRYYVEAFFPDGSKDSRRITIEIDDNSDDSGNNLSGDVETSLSLDNDDYRPGETIRITGVIENGTDETITYTDCGLDVDISGVPEELSSGCGSSSGTISYSNSSSYGKTIPSGYTRTLTYNYKIPSDFDGNGNYVVRVTFPDGSRETETIYIGSSDPDFEVSIETDKSTYDPGDTIVVTGTIENVSNDTINLVGKRYNNGCNYLKVELEETAIKEATSGSCSSSLVNIERMSPDEKITLNGSFKLPDVSKFSSFSESKITTDVIVAFPGGNKATKSVDINTK